MFMTKCKKSGKNIVVTGQSKGQVKRKLCQMGINFSKCTIEECKDETCPVCGSVLKLSNDILKPADQTKCFFCCDGIKLN